MSTRPALPVQRAHRAEARRHDAQGRRGDGRTVVLVQRLPHDRAGAVHRREGEARRARSSTSSRPTATRRRPRRGRSAGSRRRSSPVTIPQRKGDPIVISKDESIRPDTTPRRSPSCGAVTKDKGGMITAGNAPGPERRRRGAGADERRAREGDGREAAGARRRLRHRRRRAQGPVLRADRRGAEADEEDGRRRSTTST